MTIGSLRASWILFVLRMPGYCLAASTTAAPERSPQGRESIQIEDILVTLRSPVSIQM
jgi:hypothetical protein